VYAKEPSALLTRILARRLAVHMSSSWLQIRDLTIPIVSYFSGFGMNKALEPLFRGSKIEAWGGIGNMHLHPTDVESMKRGRGPS
jgi:hypothetical protein